MQYRCEATTVDGFVQQLGCSYLRHGYWFYLTGEIPEAKDAQRIDAKIVARYEIAERRWERSRRKRAGRPNAHYLRYRNRWVILATSPAVFDAGERAHVKDARRDPIKLGGYSVSFRQGHVHVRIELETYRRLKAHFLELARHRSAENLVREFYSLEPWAPVRDQLRSILRAVNRSRKVARFEPIPIYCLPYRRRSVKPFESLDSADDAA